MYKGRKGDWKGPAGMFLLLFLLVMARYCAFGLRYYPQLDDYIQYHNYTRLYDFSTLQELMGILSSRPLAGIADYFFWSPMFDHMILGVALISALYAAAVLLIWDVLGRYFRTSPVLPVVMALLPLGLEGTYWMSASTRVVVGMFFAALAVRAFLNWLDGKGRGWLPLYLILQLIPFGFYEQAGLLSITLTVGAAILERTRKGRPMGRCAVSLWGVPAMGLYFLITRLLNNGGVYGSRTELVLPTSRYYWLHELPKTLWQFFQAFVGGGFFTAAKGFVRGVRMIFSGELLLWALCAAALCVLLWLTLRHREPQERTGGAAPLPLALLSGLLLAAAPVSLFLVLGNTWFSLRGTVTSFPGIALLADSLVVWLWDKLALRRGGLSVLAAVMAFVFCVAGASEVRDYRDTYDNDQRIAGLVLEAAEAEGLNASSGRIGVLNLEPSYLPNQNFYYHEHIHGCTESGWAFNGLLTALGGEVKVSPLPADPLYRAWNREANHPSGFETLYWFDGESLTPAALRELEENTYQVQDRQGELLGVIWEENGIGYIRRPEQLAPEQSFLLEN